MDKLDLINTVNQLLVENRKLKGDKTQLEEEVKTQRRSNALERVQSKVTPRDVALCASNKVWNKLPPIVSTTSYDHGEGAIV